MKEKKEKVIGTIIMIKNKRKPQWRMTFDIEYPDYAGGRIDVCEDWISYMGIGFNPNTSYKQIIKEQTDKLRAIKFAYKKWQLEFKNNK